MIASALRLWDNFRGGGDAGVTVPPMDGALRPNQLLEQAPAVLAIEAPDNLVCAGGRALFSSGGAIYRLDAVGTATEVERFGQNVTALALEAGGALAIGLDDGRVLVRRDGRPQIEIDGLNGQRLICPTALLFASPDELVIAQGSASRPASQWKHDVMERGATGSVWRFDLTAMKATRLADRLSWPYGLTGAGAGALAATESWRHRVITIGADGAIKPVLEDLPGYPARLSPAAGGGYWLAVFAPRGQLIEFVQREKAFRREMMAGIHPDHWAAPSLSSSQTFLEPLQGGAQKHLGMVKPWAPTRSYGLVVRLDPTFQPIASYHSRADGKRHGVTSCVEIDGRVLATSKGGHAIVGLNAALSSLAGGH